MESLKTPERMAKDSAKSNYNREKEVKAFDESKIGVKGLVDSGVDKIPRIFIHDPNRLNKHVCSGNSKFGVPVIDLEGIDNEDASKRSKVVEEIKEACETGGFFQIVKHGIPVNILEEVIEGVCGFHEQDPDVKKNFYSRDYMRKAYYNTNFDLHQSPSSNWRDTLICILAPRGPTPQDLPSNCR